MRVRVTGPFGEEEEIVLEVEQDFEEFDRYRINRGFQNLPVTGPGTINFYIEHRAEEGWDLKKRIPLMIERVEGEENPENDEAALAE